MRMYPRRVTAPSPSLLEEIKDHLRVGILSRHKYRVHLKKLADGESRGSIRKDLDLFLKTTGKCRAYAFQMLSDSGPILEDGIALSDDCGRLLLTMQREDGSVRAPTPEGNLERVIMLQDMKASQKASQNPYAEGLTDEEIDFLILYVYTPEIRYAFFKYPPFSLLLSLELRSLAVCFRSVSPREYALPSVKESPHCCCFPHRGSSVLGPSCPLETIIPEGSVILPDEVFDIVQDYIGEKSMCLCRRSRKRVWANPITGYKLFQLRGRAGFIKTDAVGIRYIMGKTKPPERGWDTIPTAEARRCMGTTLKESRCKRMVRIRDDESPYCRSHKSQGPPRPLLHAHRFKLGTN